MSNRLSPEKANLIASEYCTNGFAKVKALLSAGYKHTYANSNVGLKLFDNVQVKQAISRILAANKVESSLTVKLLTEKLWSIYDKASAKGDLATCTRCLELLGKTIGAYTDVQRNEQQPPMVVCGLEELKTKGEA